MSPFAAGSCYLLRMDTNNTAVHFRVIYKNRLRDAWISGNETADREQAIIWADDMQKAGYYVGVIGFDADGKNIGRIY